MPPDSWRGIDVGTGVNLYPALSMLPFCREITLYEHSDANIRWLQNGRREGWRNSWADSYREFWQELVGHGGDTRPPYQRFAHPLDELTRRSRIVSGSLYDLAPAPGDDPWDIGTMFFVAESITRQKDEFTAGVDRFLTALAPGAPFVIAFMEHRTRGYHVGTEPFPSTDIGVNDVVSYLDGRVELEKPVHIGVGNEPLDDPYTGMIIAYGRVGCTSAH